MKDPFVNFKHLSNADKGRLRSFAISKLKTRDPAHQRTVELAMKEFEIFLIEALLAIKEKFKPEEIEFEDPIPAAPESGQDLCDFMKKGWTEQAPIWAFIETAPTYYLTMLTILEKLAVPRDGYLSTVSLGSGPGIYEAFLARTYGKFGIGGMITCVDFSPGMTEVNSFLAKRFDLSNLRAITSDMTAIPISDASVDFVLCNNSLQWCPEWKKALVEVTRILDPERGRSFDLVVHRHDMGMCFRKLSGETILSLKVSIDEIMDELCRLGFHIQNTRQLSGSNGHGQLGGAIERVFISSIYDPQNGPYDWRKAKFSMVDARFLTK